MDLDEACRRIIRAGLQITAGCIIGFDQEKPGADQRLLDFAIRTHIPKLFVTLLQAGPGTDLWDRLAREGRLLSTSYEHLSNQTGLLNFVPTRPQEEIVEEFIRLYELPLRPRLLPGADPGAFPGHGTSEGEKTFFSAPPL